MNSSRQEPLVSIIMNCYDCKEFLRQSIDSVYQQTYANWEIVFWDNASVDFSSIIAKSYDSRLRYFQAPMHTRLYEARNLALKHCRGKYVAFLDCDDTWNPDKLQLQVYECSKGIDFVYTSFDIIDKFSNKLKTVSCTGIDSISKRRLLKKNEISISSVLISRKVLLNYFFDTRFNLLGDFELWLRLSSNNITLTCLNKVLQKSRIHENNTSNIDKNLWIIERRMLYIQLLSKLKICDIPQIFIYIIKNEIRFLINFF
jgi:glycosyltransferase involved in cell wall biosynthesis